MLTCKKYGLILIHEEREQGIEWTFDSHALNSIWNSIGREIQRLKRWQHKRKCKKKTN